MCIAFRGQPSVHENLHEYYFLKWMPKQKRAQGRPKNKLDGKYKEGHERKKPK
jgi:hypothetical protein